MKNLVILAVGAAAFAVTPAAAQPAHAGKNKHQQHTQNYPPPNAQGPGHCPHGLQKKAVPCVPPGQAKKMYEQGYRFPSNYSQWTPYSQIPYDVRQRYDLDPRGRYVYDQNYVYRVDPTTLVVREVLDAIF